MKLTPVKMTISDRERLCFQKYFKRGVPKIAETSWTELHEVRSEIIKRSREMLDLSESEKRNLLEDEEVAYSLASEMLDCINQEFRNREEKGTKDPINWSASFSYPDGYPTPEGKFVYATKGERQGTGKEFRNLFYAHDPDVALSTDGFVNIAEFFQCVASQKRDERLREARVEGRSNVIKDGISGGFAAPAAFTADLMDKALLADEIFRPLSLVLPMEAGSVAAPMFDMDTRTDGDLMGLSLEFYGENEDMTVQTGKLKSKTLIAKKGAILWEESRELVQDGPAFHAKLTTMLPRIIANGLDRNFYKGNGVAKPLGAINCNSTLKVTRNTGGSILYADIKGLWGKLHPQCLKNAIWIVNAASIPQLLALKDDNNNAIWFPGMSGSVKDGVPQTLYGRPVFYCEAAPALGTTGDIALLDPTWYVIGLRQDMIVETSNAPGWTRDVVSFRITLRLDGMPMMGKAITMEDGTQLTWAAVLT